MHRYAVITGASRGIGKSIAAQFLKENWHVINIARSNCELAGVDNCSMDLQQINSLPLEKLKHLFPAANQICLVHNAAAYFKDNIYNVTGEQLQNSLAVSILAPVLLNQALLPTMTPGSSIIYIGSTLSETAVPNAASYSISKHAVVGLMRASCQDLAPGIHTCCICPGFTETEMLHTHIGHHPETVQAIKKRVKANRLIQPQEIAALVYYCAQNPVINGAVIHAHLGQIAY